MTVEEMLGRMTSRELTEWGALYEVRLDEQRIAQAAAEAKQRARKMAGGR